MATDSSIKALIKVVVESIILVVVAAAVFPVLQGAIENATGFPQSAATIIALLPLVLALVVAYKLITKALDMM
jgi:fucose permease